MRLYLASPELLNYVFLLRNVVRSLLYLSLRPLVLLSAYKTSYILSQDKVPLFVLVDAPQINRQH